MQKFKLPIIKEKKKHIYNIRIFACLFKFYFNSAASF